MKARGPRRDIRVPSWYVAPETSSITVSHGEAQGGDDVTNASHRSASETAPPGRLPLLSHPVLVTVPALVPALVFAAQDPDRNRWPALVLGLALVLDHAARLVSRRVQATTGVETALRGLPSPILGLGNAAWIGALAMAVGASLRPALFPLLACALAGLVAMGAVARLALARMVIVIDAADRAEAEAKRRGTGAARGGGRGTGHE